MDTKTLQKPIKKYLKKIPDNIKIDQVILFGSHLEGNATKDSDIDILIIGNLTFAEIAERLAPIQKTLGREINPTVFEADEFQDKLKKGHHFLNSILKSDFIYLIGDEIELKRLAEKRVAG